LNLKNITSKRIVNKAGNFLFFGLLLFFVFSTEAKSWVLEKLVSVGLFKAEIKKEGQIKDLAQNDHAFSFYDSSGQTLSTSDLKGKVIFINFWATWCPPCRAEMPSLNALYNKFKEDDRFVFLFINEDDDLSKAKAYLQKEGFNIPLSSRAGNVPSQIYNGTLPTTIVLDKEGKVVLKEEGLAAYNTPSFIQQLKDLL
jgi:thiol-disulfide isomerase/thioredoxin